MQLWKDQISSSRRKPVKSFTMIRKSFLRMVTVGSVKLRAISRWMRLIVIPVSLEQSFEGKCFEINLRNHYTNKDNQINVITKVSRDSRRSREMKENQSFSLVLRKHSGQGNRALLTERCWGFPMLTGIAAAFFYLF